MRHFNRKGFTLIELLAVIVILAIILVITIPTVLSTLKNARQDAFDASTNSVAEWFEKQYTVTLIEGPEQAYYDLCGSDSATCMSSAGASLTSNAAKAAGINDVDYNVSASKVKIYSNGRVCVKLVSTAGKRFSSVKSPRCSTICDSTDIAAFGCITG